MSHFKIKATLPPKQVFWLYDKQVKFCQSNGELANYVECDIQMGKNGPMYGFRKKTADELQAEAAPTT